MAVAPLGSSRCRSRIGCPGVRLQARSTRGLFSTGPLQCGFQFPCWRLLLLSAAGKVVSVRISSSAFVRATLYYSSHLNDSFLLTPLVLATVNLGVCSDRYMMRGRWGPSLSSLPYLHTHQQFSSSLFPRFSVFCHTSASSLNPHLNSTVTCPGFPCSSF